MKKINTGIFETIFFGLVAGVVVLISTPVKGQLSPLIEVHNLNQREHLTRSALDLLVQSPVLSTPTQTSPSTQQQPEVIPVTQVQVVKTNVDIRVILNTPNSQKTEFFSKAFGSELLTYFLNTKLQLAVGQEFHLKNPKPGIESVDVTQLDSRTVQIRMVGKKFAPSVSVEQDSGRVVESIMPVLSTAQQQKPTASDSNKQPIEIDVTAKPDTGYNATDATTGTRTLTPNREVPQTVESVPRQVIEDQADNRVGDVLRNLGITQNAEPSRLGDSVNIRGFDVEASNTLRDGLRDNLSSLIGVPFQNDLANIERIEVLKGPASVLYGNGSPGGLYNLITKQPLSTPHYSIEGQVGSYSLYKSSIDFTGPLTPDKKLLYRFNGDYENSGSYIDHAYAERTFFAPQTTVPSLAPFKFGTLSLSATFLKILMWWVNSTLLV